MTELLKTLCDRCGTSGREDRVREYIYNQVKDFADCRVDALGNLICEKKGEHRAAVKVVVDAHMDEVGIIAMAVNERGFVKFKTVGGIEPEALLAKRFCFENGAVGVVCMKPVHLCSADESGKMPSVDTMVLDIGASTRAEALSKISIGETAVYAPDFTALGDMVCSKALDDRIGCAVLIKLLKQPAAFDFTAVFSTREEIGGGGAKVAAFSTACEAALVLEATTAADLPGSAGSDRVTVVGEGVALSLMDRQTLYDKKLYDGILALAGRENIPCQTKQKVAGGNNAGVYHVSRGGVRTAAFSVPCRYLHSPSCTASMRDVRSMVDLVAAVLPRLANGEL